MQTSRRTVFKAAGIAGLTGALSLSFPTIANAVPDLDADGYLELRIRWVDQLTGRDLLDPSDPRFSDSIKELDENAQEFLSLMGDPGADPVFPEWSWDQVWTIAETAQRVRVIATAWATPGSALFEDAAVRDRAIQALRDFRAAIFHPGQPEFGNWYTWEIATTQAYGDTVAILFDHLTETDIAEFCESIDFYVPDPWEQYPEDRPRVVSEGANRVDLCQAVVIRSIIGQDPERLQHAIAGLSDVWQYVEEADGFYPDGSFLQHGTIGYTGTYGVVLLTGLSKLFALLAGTDRDITDPSRANILDAVENSFAPLIHDGQMMDAVRGRGISREHVRATDNGNDAIEAVLRLASAVEAGRAAHWRGLCRAWIEDNSFSSILDPAGASIINTPFIPRLALVTDLMGSAIEPIRLPVGAHFFPQMDRLIYRGEGWASAVAMCSNRIGWYECGNGENDLGVHTSQGMTYLYLGHDDTHFDGDFWATCDLQGLPGTTLDTTQLPPKVEGEWGVATPQNEWTGGATLSDVALAGQHLLGPGDTGLTARKTWVFLPHAIIALGSDISTGTDAEVKTVVEHRNLGANPRALTLDGSPVGQEPVTATDAAWAHLEGVGGYLFLEASELRAVQAKREGTWNRNNANGSSEVHHHIYASIETIHSAGHAGYAYVVLPGADETETQAAAADPGIEIVRNDEVAQAVQHGRLLAASFWQAGEVQKLSMHDPASVLLRRSGREIEVSISDPTHAQKSVSFTLRGNPKLRASDSERVIVTEVRGGIDVLVDTTGLGGRPVDFTVNGPSISP